MAAILVAIFDDALRLLVWFRIYGLGIRETCSGDQESPILWLCFGHCRDHVFPLQDLSSFQK